MADVDWSLFDKEKRPGTVPFTYTPPILNKRVVIPFNLARREDAVRAVKRAYRKVLSRVHPDKVPPEQRKEANVSFSRLSEELGLILAYVNVLLDHFQKSVSICSVFKTLRDRFETERFFYTNKDIPTEEYINFLMQKEPRPEYKSRIAELRSILRDLNERAVAVEPPPQPSVHDHNTTPEAPLPPKPASVTSAVPPAERCHELYAAANAPAGQTSRKKKKKKKKDTCSGNKGKRGRECESQVDADMSKGANSGKKRESQIPPPIRKSERLKKKKKTKTTSEKESGPKANKETQPTPNKERRKHCRIRILPVADLLKLAASKPLTEKARTIFKTWKCLKARPNEWTQQVVLAREVAEGGKRKIASISRQLSRIKKKAVKSTNLKNCSDEDVLEFKNEGKFVYFRFVAGRQASPGVICRVKWEGFSIDFDGTKLYSSKDDWTDFAETWPGKPLITVDGRETDWTCVGNDKEDGSSSFFKYEDTRGMRFLSTDMSKNERTYKKVKKTGTREKIAGNCERFFVELA